MMIITHGYDYTLPYNKNRGFFLSVQRIINEFLDTGHWLYEPLTTKGISKKYDQEAVMYAMIYEFNEMLIQLANFKGLPNLFHIDCRGFASLAGCAQFPTIFPNSHYSAMWGVYCCWDSVGYKARMI